MDCRNIEGKNNKKVESLEPSQFSIKLGTKDLNFKLITNELGRQYFFEEKVGGSMPFQSKEEGLKAISLFLGDLTELYGLSKDERLKVDFRIRNIVTMFAVESTENIDLIEDEWVKDAQNYREIDAAKNAIETELSSPGVIKKPREAYLEATKISYKYFFVNGRFFWDPRSREAYWFDTKSKVLRKVDGEDFKTLASNTLAVNREDIAFKWIISGIKDRVAGYAKQVEPKRFSHFDSETKTLYFNHKPGKVLKLDGDRIEEVDNGEPFLFIWDESWDPVEPMYDAKGSLDDLLFNRLILDDGCTISIEEAKIVIDRWLIGIFFRSITPARPILALIGPQGSGKTVFTILIGLLLFGRRFSVLGIEGQKQDGAIAYITNNVYGVFDNADEPISWLPDLLARAATGMSIPRRKLFTTNDLITYPTDIFLAITARQTPWARPDVIDRLFLFPVKRPERFLDDEKLKRSILQSRPKLVGELLIEANSAVKRLRYDNDSVGNSPMRLSSFYNFAVKASEDPATLGKILQKMIDVQEDLSFEQEEALITLLKKWVESRVGRQQALEENTIKWTDDMSPSEVYANLTKFAKEDGFKFTVRNSLSLSHLLRAYANTLKTSGILFEKNRIGSGVKWKFSLPPVQKKVEEKPTQPTQPAPKKGREGLMVEQDKLVKTTPDPTEASQVQEMKDVKVIDDIQTKVCEMCKNFKNNSCLKHPEWAVVTPTNSQAQNCPDFVTKELVS